MLQENVLVDKQTETVGDPHKLYVMPSPIQGVGVFLGVNLAAGAILLEIKGEHIIHHEYDPFLADKNPNWIGIGYCEWIKIEEGNKGLYVNHSCKPNVIVNDKLQVVTLKPVKAHEEITMDYSTTELDPDWMMHCNCGNDCCRKVLKSFQFLPKNIQQKYGRFIAPVFMENV